MSIDTTFDTTIRTVTDEVNRQTVVFVGNGAHRVILTHQPWNTRGYAVEASLIPKSLRSFADRRRAEEYAAQLVGRILLYTPKDNPWIF